MNRDAGNLLKGLLLGAVVGGVTALLMAPASGSDTRKKIKDTLRRGKDKVFDGVDGVRDFAEAQKEGLKEAVIAGKSAYQKAVLARSQAEATS